jgi:hypothetical protein
LVATARSHKQNKRSKKVISKARVLTKVDADKVRVKIEAKEAAKIAYQAVMDKKKQEQILKKAQKQTEKTKKATQRALVKDTRETNAEMT